MFLFVKSLVALLVEEAGLAEVTHTLDIFLPVEAVGILRPNLQSRLEKPRGIFFDMPSKHTQSQIDQVGVLIKRYDFISKRYREVLTDLHRKIPKDLWEGYIRHETTIAKAWARGQSIFVNARDTDMAEMGISHMTHAVFAFEDLVREMVHRQNQLKSTAPSTTQKSSPSQNVSVEKSGRMSYVPIVIGLIGVGIIICLIK